MFQLSPEQVQRLAAAPVGHLSTAAGSGAPHVIPVCFVLDNQSAGHPIYSVLDQKPKRAALTRLRRVRNILDNPQVALVVDHYEPDWGKLWYILVTGMAELLTEDTPPAHPEPVEGLEHLAGQDERSRAIHLLRVKYPQYREMEIDANPVIKITPRRVTAWDANSFPQNP